MSDDVLVRVDSLSKKFSRAMKQSMLYGMYDIMRDFTGIPVKSDQLRKTEFWALQDVSFELKRGECLGLIGANGSGKSTLLKLINGIFMPDKGRIETKGRVGALIELGAGFHPMLSGRENIYISGAILGLSRKEIDDKFDSIVEFSELEDFIDTPIKFYSSGMYVRLGFAVAAHLEPDILLIDEVLAVGDVGFRAKCYNLIANLRNTSAVILVSHSLPMIARYSSRVIVMNQGVPFTSDDKSECFHYYYDLYKDNDKTPYKEIGNNHLEHISLINENYEETDVVTTGEKMRIRLKAKVEDLKPSVNLAFLTQENTIVANVRSQAGDIFCKNGQIDHVIEIDSLVLTPGKYKLTVLILDKEHKKHLIWHEALLPFKVDGPLSDYGPTSVIMKARFLS